VADCEQGCARTAEVPMLVDYGSIFEPPVEEMWCAECAAQQIIDKAEAWPNICERCGREPACQTHFGPCPETPDFGTSA